MMYVEGDLVVLRVIDVNQIGVVTSTRRAKGKIIGYDVRTEKGSAYCVCTVDKPLTGRDRSEYSINSTLTRSFLAGDIDTNLAFDRRISAHTRANYNSDLYPLDEDTQMEKCNDFSFPVVGGRSW
jgi:hypothetical protein